MSDLWEPTFARHQAMWGEQPTQCARLAAARFAEANVRRVLIPGVGYGRNALPFLELGMEVVGIEVSETAIGLARERMGLTFPIHHGSVTDMPFDAEAFDGIFCFGLLYLLDAPARARLLADCAAQLAPGGEMVFTLVAKEAPMYGLGVRLGEDWYENPQGMRLYFYDEASIEAELGPHRVVACRRVEEPAPSGVTLPFWYVVCRP